MVGVVSKSDGTPSGRGWKDGDDGEKEKGDEKQMLVYVTFGVTDEYSDSGAIARLMFVGEMSMMLASSKIVTDSDYVHPNNWWNRKVKIDSLDKMLNLDKLHGYAYFYIRGLCYE